VVAGEQAALLDSVISSLTSLEMVAVSDDDDDDDDDDAEIIQ